MLSGNGLPVSSPEYGSSTGHRISLNAKMTGPAASHSRALHGLVTRREEKSQMVMRRSASLLAWRWPCMTVRILRDITMASSSALCVVVHASMAKYSPEKAVVRDGKKKKLNVWHWLILESHFWRVVVSLSSKSTALSRKRSNIYICAAFHETGALRVFECFEMKSNKFFLSLKVSSALHFVYVLCLW